VKKSGLPATLRSAACPSFTTGADGGSVYFGDTWQFDGQSWSNVTPSSGPSPSARSNSWMVSYGGKVLLYGGDAGGVPFDDTWQWDGSSWTEVPVSGTGGRTSHAMATFGSTVVLFGGFDQNGNVSGDTWLYDGAAWSNPNAAGPPKRATHTMVTR
jgi:Galactose oxidase, central domain